MTTDQGCAGWQGLARQDCNHLTSSVRSDLGRRTDESHIDHVDRGCSKHHFSKGASLDSHGNCSLPCRYQASRVSLWQTEQWIKGTHVIGKK